MIALAIYLPIAIIKLTYIRTLFDYRHVEEMTKYICFLLLGIKCIFFDVKDRHFFIGLILGVVFMGNMYVIDAKDMMLPLFFILCARDIPYKLYFIEYILIQLSIMFLTVLLCSQGIIQNEIWKEGSRIRYALGYRYCTYGAHIFLFCCLIYGCVRTKLYFIEMLIMILVSFLWYRYTNTRIDLLLSIPAIAFCYAWKKSSFEIKDSWLGKGIFYCGSEVSIVAAIWGQWFYNENSSAWIRINDMLNGRLLLGKRAISQYPLQLWGQYIKWVGAGTIRKHPEMIYNYVDCSYLKYTLNYGLLFMIVIMIALYFLGKYVLLENNKGLMVAYLVWLIFGMIDAEFLVLAFQPFMLLLGVGISMNKTSHHFSLKNDDKARVNQQG